MSSKKDQGLLLFLEKISLENYYKSFREQGVTLSDLEFLEQDDVEEIIPKKFHRKKFLLNVKSMKGPKKEGKGDSGDTKKSVETKGEKFEKAAEKNEEEAQVQMKVKFGNDVKIVYDVPLVTNEVLIGKLVQSFLECELKLADKTILTKDRRLTLEKWLKKTGESLESEIRGVLTVKGMKSGGESEETKERVKELEKKLEMAEKEKDVKNFSIEKKVETLQKVNKELEKKLEKVERERNGKDAELKSLSRKLKLVEDELKKESMYRQRERDDRNRMGAELSVLKDQNLALLEKLNVLEGKKKKSGGGPPGFKVLKGIYVPVNVRFLKNDNYRSKLQGVFGHGDRSATTLKDGSLCFKASVEFKAGNKYYFEATVNIVCGGWMGIGVMDGRIYTHRVGAHSKGWEFNCSPGSRELYSNCKSSEYGPRRKKGRYVIGILCDFTGRKKEKGKISFIVDGKNCGVAFKNVKPPVSPAFNFYDKGDSFSIDEITSIPSGVK